MGHSAIRGGIEGSTDKSRITLRSIRATLRSRKPLPRPLACFQGFGFAIACWAGGFE
jgi:hypothetical protein